VGGRPGGRGVPLPWRRTRYAAPVQTLIRRRPSAVPDRRIIDDRSRRNSGEINRASTKPRMTICCQLLHLGLKIAQNISQPRMSLNGHDQIEWGTEVSEIIVNDTRNFFLKLQISILVISNHNSFRVLFDKITFVYFI